MGNEAVSNLFGSLSQGIGQIASYSAARDIESERRAWEDHLETVRNQHETEHETRLFAHQEEQSQQDWAQKVAGFKIENELTAARDVKTREFEGQQHAADRSIQSQRLALDDRQEISKTASQLKSSMQEQITQALVARERGDPQDILSLLARSGDKKGEEIAPKVATNPTGAMDEWIDHLRKQINYVDVQSALALKERGDPMFKKMSEEQIFSAYGYKKNSGLDQEGNPVPAVAGAGAPPPPGTPATGPQGGGGLAAGGASGGAIPTANAAAAPPLMPPPGGGAAAPAPAPAAPQAPQLMQPQGPQPPIQWAPEEPEGVLGYAQGVGQQAGQMLGTAGEVLGDVGRNAGALTTKVGSAPGKAVEKLADKISSDPVIQLKALAAKDLPMKGLKTSSRITTTGKVGRVESEGESIPAHKELLELANSMGGVDSLAFKRWAANHDIKESEFKRAIQRMTAAQ